MTTQEWYVQKSTLKLYLNTAVLYGAQPIYLVLLKVSGLYPGAIYT